MNKASTILIIEDDPDITCVIQDALDMAGFTTYTADSGITGLTRARELQPDLVILDLGLPDFNGAEVARRLRKTSSVPIIVLTALDAVDCKIDLLEAGADDYITKPFHPEELVARVKVQLRHGQHGDVLSIDQLQVHVQKRLATYAGHELRLSPKEFDVLTLLARQPGRVFSREEMRRDVWGDSIPTDSNVIDVHMANLRGKLRECGAYGVIRTVRGIGYALRAGRRTDAPTTETTVTTPAPTRFITAEQR